jgi:small subunit ribosomal protein S1
MKVQLLKFFDKGAVIALPYGVEGFATPKHLVKEDGTMAKVEEKSCLKLLNSTNQPKR